MYTLNENFGIIANILINIHKVEEKTLLTCKNPIFFNKSPREKIL